MSRLYGRKSDVYNISNFLIDHYKDNYKLNKTEVPGESIVESSSYIAPYLSSENIGYVDDQNIELYYNRLCRETIFSGYGEKSNAIFFPSKQMREEYKREYIYFIGELLKRKSLDFVPHEFDISCQYSEVLPLLLEALYLREVGQSERFSPKHLRDFLINAKVYKKMYERHERRYGADENIMLANTLKFLVPLSSMDATLQIFDRFGQDDEELKRLIDELIENKDHNREKILAKRDIDTYGFGRLREEIIKH